MGTLKAGGFWQRKGLRGCWVFVLGGWGYANVRGEVGDRYIKQTKQVEIKSNY